MNFEHHYNENTISSDEISSDNEGYTKYESRSARKKRLRNLLGAPPPVRYVFVNRVTSGNPNILANYLNDKKVEFEKIERKSHPNSKYKSFKVTMYKDQLSTVLNNGFWPKGVKCKVWREPSSSFASDVRFDKNRSNSLFDSRYIFSKNVDNQHNIDSFKSNRKSFSNF